MEFNEKQIQIIEATEKLFAEKGYEGTSVRDIAQDAGVNVAMISYYFGSKEKLMEALFVHRISLSRLTLENLLQNKELKGFEKIDKLIDNYVSKIMSNPCFHRIIMPAKMAKEMKDVTKIIYENKLRNLDLVTRIIQEGQKNKEFVKQVDVPMLIITMLGSAYQILNNLPFYRIMYKIEDLSDEEVNKHLSKKLTTHLKQLFKAILTYDHK